MRSLLPAFVAAFVVVLGLSVPARADFDAGFAAYQRGDYQARPQGPDRAPEESPRGYVSLMTDMLKKFCA